ncbi:MAG: response regulator transcription factor [Anaerolineales bacterium]|nr:response regulator transcription factor [Anaerolineales bacterium]
MSKKILIIDDDPDLRKLVEVILKSPEFDVYQASSGEEGLRQAYAIHPDLVILDISMPHMDGFEVCSRLREFSSFPIMMLTARIHEHDMLHGFNMGADDYLRKPFSKIELEARVRALLRRSNTQNSDEASYITAYIDPVLEINLSAKAVKLNGNIVELSPKNMTCWHVLCVSREKPYLTANWCERHGEKCILAAHPNRPFISII